MSSIKPVGNKILVLPIEKKEEVIGAIIIPGTVNAQLQEGEVVAVSDQVKDLYKKGDIVLYAEKKGVAQLIKNKPHLWLDTEPNLGEIYGIVTPEVYHVDNGDNL
jgi:chaperonin GroES